MKQMRAAVLYGAEDVRLEQRPVPAVGPGEVRVTIAAALTCGTDAKVFRRGYHAKMIRPPAVFGHEFAGTIEALGEGATAGADGPVALGDRVVAANSAPCGACFHCRRDQLALCEDLLFLNGAYAESITVPARIVSQNLWHVPAELAFEAAALAEPLACCVKGLEDTGVQAGETIVVLGLGPIGLMMVCLAAAGGARVLAVGRRSPRLAAADALGAAVTIDESACEDLSAAIRDLTAGLGADRVIECVGVPEAWEQAIALTRKGGTCNLFGGCTAGSKITVDCTRLHYEELRLLGSFHHTPRHIKAALDLLAAGTVPSSVLINDRIGLADVPEALRRMGGRGHLIKAAVDVAG
jgi:L-iditol 2-dehydrogenase